MQIIKANHQGKSSRQVIKASHQHVIASGRATGSERLGNDGGSLNLNRDPHPATPKSAKLWS
jgi:hypothetical protein